MTTRKKGRAEKRAQTNAKPRTKKTAAKAPAKAPAEHAHGLKPGATLTRTYKGKTLTLEVTPEGFRFDGTLYRSLTAAAKAATKYPSISGVVFWLQPARKAAAKDGAQ